MNILADSRSVLEDAGYTALVPATVASAFYFEDLSVMGVLHVLDSVKDIISLWANLQRSFLTTNAAEFSKSPTKAWNIYSVYLTADAARKEDRSRLVAIEEDFTSTRKIARANIATRGSLERALDPLLPIRRSVVLSAERAEAILQKRLSSISQAARLFVSDTDAREIALQLLDAK